MRHVIDGGCPRRVETGSSRGLPDRWIKRNGARVCSYCGSSSPDVFMSELAAGTLVIGTTDKNYKVYIEHGSAKLGIKFYLQHLSAEQRIEFVRLYNKDREIRRYAEDLSFTIEQAGAMKIGYPGYFPAGVFFAQPA